MPISSLTKLREFVEAQILKKTFPTNTSISVPLVTQKGNRLFYACFLFDDSQENDSIYRPFAWAIVPVDPSSHDDFTFNYCSLLDFTDTDRYPFENKVSSLPAENSTAFMRELYHQEMSAILCEIATFAFSENLTAFQQTMVARFRELFLLTAYTGLYPFYAALEFRFLDWLKLDDVIKDFRSPGTLENRPEESLLDKIFPKLGQIETKLAGLEEIKRDVEKLANNHNYNIEKDIILVIDHINKTIESFPMLETNNQEKELVFIKNIRQDLIDLLYRYGVEPFQVIDNIVDVSKQKILETEYTDDPSLDKTISQRISAGWEKNNIIIKPEQIKAFLLR